MFNFYSVLVVLNPIAQFFIVSSSSLNSSELYYCDESYLSKRFRQSAIRLETLPWLMEYPLAILSRSFLLTKNV
jgi:hypothetical protein